MAGLVSYIALLRGINVGGKNMVPMADLRAFFEENGLAEPKTLLQSGNVVFKAKPGNMAALEAKLEKAAAKKWAGEIVFLIRDAAQWRAIAAGNPYPAEAKADPGHLHVMCLKSASQPAAEAALRSAIVGRETFLAGTNCLYIVYPDGSGDSRFTNALIERKLGTRGSSRNWNTVLKIAALLD